MSDSKIDTTFELDALMERLVLLLAEYNQPFLERTLQIIDKAWREPRFIRLFTSPNSQIIDNGVKVVGEGAGSSSQVSV